MYWNTRLVLYIKKDWVAQFRDELKREEVSLVHWNHSTCVVDLNEESRQARSVAGTPVNDSSAEPYAIHINERLDAFDNFMLSIQPPYHTGFFDYAIDESYQRTRQNTMKQSLPHGISLIPTIVYGSRVQNIVDILRKYLADLCVMSLRNKTDWWRLVFTPKVIQ